ncbi:YebC/PmpR family DNA-binding transcriptional regulator [Patescibacteria group bacterium]|nr:YebC/PmpR family DNA-binding transcriptional regulator [Patescibacteria group bacterium]
MSGHSKWHNIKHRKEGADKKRGKIFTKHAKLIQIAAAAGGGDPNMNPSLRAAIDSAKADNVPVDNIERAIKKGTGESKDASVIEEVFYEGFGPGGTALYIEALTDNRNRTITNLKIIMGRNGGIMGAAGSTGYLFQRKGLIEIFLPEHHGSDDIELAAIDAGADDVKKDGDLLQIYTDPQRLMKVRADLEKGGVKTKSAAIVYEPQSTVEISDETVARHFFDLIDALEEDEDVSTVYTNGDVAAAVLEKL